MSGCGADLPATPPPPEDRSCSVALNYGHVAVVTVAQLAAGGAVTLHIQGSSIHDHTLELADDDVKRIARGEFVSVLSSAGWEDKHDHRISFN